MDQGDPIPDHLLGVYRVLECAFPGGINEEEYWPVLSLLHQDMSFWAIAKVLSVLAGKHYMEVYNDASGYGLDPPPPREKVEKAKQKLNACGFDDWLKQM